MGFYVSQYFFSSVTTCSKVDLALTYVCDDVQLRKSWKKFKWTVLVLVSFYMLGSNFYWECINDLVCVILFGRDVLNWSGGCFG